MSKNEECNQHDNKPFNCGCPACEKAYQEWKDSKNKCNICNSPIEVKKCANCGKEHKLKDMKVTMVNQMHRYVCDSKCLIDLYK